MDLTPSRTLNVDEFREALDAVAKSKGSFMADDTLGIDEESLQHVALTLAFPALQSAHASAGPDAEYERVANVALIAATQIAFAAGVFFERTRIEQLEEVS